MGSLPSSTQQITVEESVHMLKSKREAAGLSLCPLTRPHSPRQARSLGEALPQRPAREPAWAPSVGRAGMRQGCRGNTGHLSPPRARECTCTCVCVPVSPGPCDTRLGTRSGRRALWGPAFLVCSECC